MRHRPGFRCNAYRDDTTYVIACDLPGVERDNIQISCLPNHVLSVTATREDPVPADKSRMILETTYGVLSRTFTLRDADLESTHAEFANGVLVLTIPKIPEKSTSINIAT